MDILYAGLPVKLANYIAKSCDLPGLFLGTYEGRRIDYIYLLEEILRNGARQGAKLIVIRCDGQRMGLLLDRDLSALVWLNKPDPIFDLLKRYKNFSHGKMKYDVSRLEARLLFDGGISITSSSDIANPQLPVSELWQAYHQTKDNIKKHLVSPARLLVPGIPTVYGDWTYPGMPEADKHIKNDFDKRHQYLALFGQSDLFGLPDAPHDTEYLLLLERRMMNMTYAFIKTKRYFRGLRHIETYPRSEDRYRHDNYTMMDLEDPTTDWERLLQDKILMQLASYASTIQIARLEIFYQNTSYSLVLDRPDMYTPQSKSYLEIWDTAQALIAQFPEDFRP